VSQSVLKEEQRAHVSEDLGAGREGGRATPGAQMRGICSQLDRPFGLRPGRSGWRAGPPRSPLTHSQRPRPSRASPPASLRLGVSKLRVVASVSTAFRTTPRPRSGSRLLGVQIGVKRAQSGLVGLIVARFEFATDKITGHDERPKFGRT